MKIPEEVNFLDVEMGVVVVPDKLHVTGVRLPRADLFVFGTDKRLAVMDNRLSKIDDKQIFEVENIILHLWEQCCQLEGRIPEFVWANGNLRNPEMDCVLVA